MMFALSKVGKSCNVTENHNHFGLANDMFQLVPRTRQVNTADVLSGLFATEESAATHADLSKFHGGIVRELRQNQILLDRVCKLRIAT